MLLTLLKRTLLVIPAVRKYVDEKRALFYENERLKSQISKSAIPLGAFSSPPIVPKLTNEEQIIVDRFHDLYYGEWREDHERLNIGWLGYQTQKTPNDLWIYQELLVELNIDTVIETGTRFGGSALFFASVFDLIGNGKVITIDINHQDNRPQHHRIKYIQGSSIDPITIDELEKHISDTARILVVLDSNHTREHVYEECKIYQHYVPIGGYLVVEDTNVNGHPTYQNHGPGPMEGLKDFLGETDRFKSDMARERFLMTCNPKGFLKKIY